MLGWNLLSVVLTEYGLQVCTLRKSIVVASCGSEPSLLFTETTLYAHKWKNSFTSLDLNNPHQNPWCQLAVNLWYINLLYISVVSFIICEFDPVWILSNHNKLLSLNSQEHRIACTPDNNDVHLDNYKFNNFSKARKLQWSFVGNNLLWFVLLFWDRPVAWMRLAH